MGGAVGDVISGNVSRSFPRHMISVSVAVIKGPGMTNTYQVLRFWTVFQHPKSIQMGMPVTKKNWLSCLPSVYI